MDQAGCGDGLQRRYVRCEGGHDQGLAQAEFAQGVLRQFPFGSGGVDAGLLVDQRLELLVPELSAVTESFDQCCFGPRLGAGVGCDDPVERVADGDDPVDGHGVAVLDEQGFHDGQGGAFALHRR